MSLTFVKRIPYVVLHCICVASGAVYILFLMGVNLIGYAVGTAGFVGMYDKLASREGLEALFWSFYFLCFLVKLMLFLQDRGLAKK